jgi:hypothetical protein
MTNVLRVCVIEIVSCARFDRKLLQSSNKTFPQASVFDTPHYLFDSRLSRTLPDNFTNPSVKHGIVIIPRTADMTPNFASMPMQQTM